MDTGNYGEGHSPTILIVDDDQTAAAVTAQMLSRSGMEAVVARDGSEGVKFFEEREGVVDLVILDLIMPRMGGEETFNALRRIDRTVPILIASGLSENKLTERFLDQDAVSFIQKPFPLNLLIEKVREALGRK